MNGNLVKFPLNESEIKSIRPLNETVSTLATIGIFSGVALILLNIIVINAANNLAKEIIIIPSIP